MAHSYDNHDYWRTEGRTDPMSEYSSSGRTLGPYPTALPRTDAWAGDTWRKTDHDATYGRSTLSSYPQHATWTAPPRSYAVSGDNWHNKQPGTTGRTYDRRGSFDEYVMKVATDYITPTGPVSSSSYVRSQNPNEYNDFFKKDFYKSNGYHPRSSEHGSNNLRPGYTNNDMMVRSSGQYGGAPMSDPTNNIGLALDYLKKEATAGSTAPTSQYGVHRMTHDVRTVETVVDPSSRYGNTTYFRRR